MHRESCFVGGEVVEGSEVGLVCIVGDARELERELRRVWEEDN
jgi:hypothetical protein